MQKQEFWLINKLNNNTAEIYLYGYIGYVDEVTASAFVKELRQLEKDYENINIRINSMGGSVFEGRAIIAAIKRSAANITMYCDGVAASMGAVIFFAGKKRYINKYAQVMIHSASTGCFGNSKELQEQAELLKDVDKGLANQIAEETGKNPDEITSKYFDGKDHWLSADQLRDEGMVTGIFDGEKVELPKNISKQDYENINASLQQWVNIKFQTNNNTMKEIVLSAATLQVLDLGGEPTAAQIDAAVAQLKTQLDAKENELKALKAATIEKEITDLLTGFVNDKKGTQEEANLLKEDYKDNVAGLKKLIEARKPMPGIVENLQVDAADPAEFKNLADKTYDQLDQEDLLDKVANKYPELFEAKYISKHGQEKWDKSSLNPKNKK